jgi:acyl carrier protein
MIAQLERRSHKNLRARLIARAWQDADFKSKLLGNPKAAIEQEFGIELPAEMTVTVVEDTPTRMHLALPVNPLVPPEERQDAEQGETAAPSPRRAHKDLKARLIARAWQDADFKSKLLGNPKAAIEQEFGIELPADMTVTVVEDTPTHLHLVLPVNRLVLAEERLTVGAGTIVAGCSCSSCSCSSCSCSSCSCSSCSSCSCGGCIVIPRRFCGFCSCSSCFCGSCSCGSCSCGGCSCGGCSCGGCS